MEEQKRDPGQTTQGIMDNLKIRSMRDDLKNAGPPVPLPGAALSAPAEKKASVQEAAKILSSGQIEKIPSQPPPSLPVQPPAVQVKQIPSLEINDSISLPSPIPPLPPTPEKTADFDQTRRKQLFKLAVIFGSLALLLAAGVSAYFLWPEQKPACAEGKISEECLCQQTIKNSGSCCNNFWLEGDCSVTKAPSPLVQPITQILPIDVKGAAPDKIISDIKNLGENTTDQSLILLAPKTGESPTTYATLGELASALDISLPSQIKNETEAYNLLLYVRPGDSKEVRLALVLKEKKESLAALLPDAMLDWEPTMLDNLKPIILGSPGEPATLNFQSVDYNGGSFRYKNLPVSATTINYTIAGELLIIGTSKNSAYDIYDAASAGD